MDELERLISETQEWKEFHRGQRVHGVRGASIEALACDIRLVALAQAKEAILREKNA